MITNYVPKEQISLETGNGHGRRPSGRPVRTATKNDKRLDGRLCVARFSSSSLKSFKRNLKTVYFKSFFPDYPHLVHVNTTRATLYFIDLVLTV